MIRKQIILLALIVNCCNLQETIGQNIGDAASKISPSIASLLPLNDSLEFIVVMNQHADISAVGDIHGKESKAMFVYQSLSDMAATSQKSLQKELDAEGIYYHPFWIVNAMLVRGKASLVWQLAARPDVKSVLSNASLHIAQPLPGNPRTERDLVIPWGIDSIHAPEVWALGYEGEGAVIGGEDTGYDWEHPAIKNQYRGWDGVTVDHNYNWHDAIHAVDIHNYGDNPCGINLTEPCDDYGHGTHTMGTMAGEDGVLKIGVAPKAKWIGERNMERGWGNLSGYLESFEWFMAPTDLAGLNPDVTKAPHVINNSWYCSVEEGCDANNFSLMEEVVNNVKSSGIVVVASAGNDGPGCNTIMFPPALFENSFTTGAVDFLLNAAEFSSRGNAFNNGNAFLKPDVAAPGVDVLSCIPDNQYAFFSGTSMAGPHVAGTVALMISANPALAGEVDQIENILRQTAKPLTTFDGCAGDAATAVPNNTFGFGMIDALAAVQKSLLATSLTAVEQQNACIKVFQSVTGDNLTIKIYGNANSATFQLFSIQGQKVTDRFFTGGSAFFQLSSIAPGIYVYHIQAGASVSSGKIIRF